VRALSALGLTVLPRGRTVERPALAVVCTRDGSRPPSSAPGLPWIWLALDEIPGRAAEDAILRGAYDCVSMPSRDRAVAAATRIRTRAAECGSPEPPIPDAAGVVADSDAGRRILRQIAQAARTSQPVLLTGETGTGKDVAARLLHAWSDRRDKPFVPVNCAAIPNELIESELFGYVRGAFSGAVQAYEGQLAAAAGGTVFLDEIDDTPFSLQVKLLRVLEDHVVSRLGENDWRRVDFRLVAATNRDLRALIAQGTFGADLYERLAIASIHIAPLRERREDVPALARHFVDRFLRDEGDRGRDPVTSITDEAMAALTAHHWPGNARELRNVIYQALIDKRAGRELLLSDLPRRILRGGHAPPASTIPTTAVEQAIAAGRFDLRQTIDELERAALRAALDRSGGNAARAARLLGVVGRGRARDPGSTVRAMMRRLRVPRGSATPAK
jgi:DNA-binding NtrC family response regulator